MNTTREVAPATKAETGITLPPALVAAMWEANATLDRRDRLDERAAGLANEIRARESEVDTLREQFALAESAAAIALCDDDEGRAQQRADELRAQLDGTVSSLDRMSARLVALEAHARSLDDAIATARVIFDDVLRGFARDTLVRLGNDLDQALAGARFILTQMRALPGDVASLFLASAFVGDPTQNLALLADLDGQRKGYKNMLAARDDELQPVEFNALLAPLLATLRRLRAHQRYTPPRGRRSFIGPNSDSTTRGSGVTQA